MIGWRTAWTIARRDLSARFRGLRLLLVCLFLGVGALAADVLGDGAGNAGRVVNGVDDPRGGGSAVEEGHLMGLQQRGRMASGTAFFLDQPGFLIAEQIMGGAARLQHNVSAEQHNRAAVAIEVATNGHFRHSKQGGGFFQM